MTILPGVVKADRYRGAHRKFRGAPWRFHLTFNDGTSKTVDFQPWLHGPILLSHSSTSPAFANSLLLGSTVCWRYLSTARI